MRALLIEFPTRPALNAPENQTTTEIRPFMHLFIGPGFLAWMGVCIVLALVGVFYLEPRVRPFPFSPFFFPLNLTLTFHDWTLQYGKKTMLVHIGICSVIGGLSVSCTQGLGASILTSIRGNNQVRLYCAFLKGTAADYTSQVTFWFFWILFAFVVVTLLVEIKYVSDSA